MTDLTTIRNIGPATATALQRVGIATAEDLRAIGADAAYARLLAAGERPHFIGYYVLHMALQGRPWNDCTPVEKAALRQRFDAIKADAAGKAAAAGHAAGFDPHRAALDAFMRDFGLIAPPGR